ncbi:uncharacterized protein LOC123504326 isoform X2 [Portunus trituberculatus]|uniref:uncharacterized protein LOC123504326 isoform X2 n=1 Tax=Portunus trituberculatus TaxID=210409 RepID=UPI001E1CB358|nr:uncharacterized protein LOC123504326 isoform X2 [Portunus trituberculatus]XP_045110689.1 uncharacterized protein LOC123504326 isoform X2 [Portunus trituberculatus]XP_045110690.1 uncharacterized protein LOC123504326 isoform X2 [Portunus trituberculatus]XP_045110691.1 uncharacterized protein LOC123504326 isoform X2 [Portunus trituberculatus]XP_045110692.1 uncharacterized protein LOC123504326 isoform X2 [Portunus trituberculatus]XP_045110693.1 uncharacterized protein LOC123504326 isoform X2 [P
MVRREKCMPFESLAKAKQEFNICKDFQRNEPAARWSRERDTDTEKKEEEAMAGVVNAADSEKYCICTQSNVTDCSSVIGPDVGTARGSSQMLHMMHQAHGRSRSKLAPTQLLAC